MKTIVVGTDGSPGAKAAVQFAAHEAAAHGATLRVVASWQVPPALLVSPEMAADLFTAIEEEARALAAESAALAKSVEPGLEVEEVVSEGHPGEVLVEQSRQVDLVVVGRRGRGGFAGLILGSVSQHVMHHAACPVVVVPPVKEG
jgi:nucleotide-binding universal stress UspA family protein